MRLAGAVVLVAACGKVNATPDAITPDAMDQHGPQTLTVARAGTGFTAVTIASDSGGIACGATCEATFDFGATVTLTAMPAGQARWSGACSGMATCVVTMTGPMSVTATTCDATPTTLAPAMAPMVQTYTVPAGCTAVTIDAFGAQGGGTMGGKGAEIVGTVTVADAEMLKVLVGAAGGGVGNNCSPGVPYGFGGGGGSFVLRADNTPLVIAGGGGGAGLNNDQPGGPGRDVMDGGSVQGATGGTGGAGGPIGTPDTGGCGFRGSGGGGLLGDGAVSGMGGGLAFANGGTPGTDPPNGGNDCCTQAPGGFGGGGAGGNGGGGGGGYSGGAGGSNGGTPVAYPGGGGGGSFNTGTNSTSTAGVRSGNGQVIITPHL